MSSKIIPANFKALSRGNKKIEKNEISAGIIVFRKPAIGNFSKKENTGVFLVLLLLHSKGHWGFSKGHKKRGEDDITSARRELMEETGIFKVKIFDTNYKITEKYSYLTGKKQINKKNKYFVGMTKKINLTIDGKEINEYKWCTYKEAKKLINFKETLITLDEAFNYVQKYYE